MTLYLDYNSTTPLENGVVETISVALREEWGNPSSSHSFGKVAKVSIEKARRNLAVMINGNDNDIIFTSGGTEANNLVIFSAVESYRKWVETQKNVPSDKPHIITSDVEHDAILLPLKHLKSRGDIDVSFVSAAPSGSIKVEDVISRIKTRTCLITIMFANNETGVIMPITDLGRAISKTNELRVKKRLFKILFHTDAAQAIGKVPVDVEVSKVDYMTIVGHKFYGPRIGCIYARDVGVTTPLYPIIFGGGQERGFRPGTENTAMIAGLGKAAELVIENLDKYMKHFICIKEYLLLRLQEEFGDSVVFNCHNDENHILPNTCNISLLGMSLTGSDILAACKTVVASIGAACHSQNKPSSILISSGVSPELARSAVRLSLGRETSKEDIDLATADLKQAVESLKK
ncbi:selenocysteine lyase-like [Hetaerina americana]|uniref:selenocysteine lyase-like n=1 Tax=Hetaerina americana TaxID=62018 RepID=UPI003A7F16DB